MPRDFERPQHGDRKRCDVEGCRGFARRMSSKCSSHGGGSRASTKRKLDEFGTGVKVKHYDKVAVSPRVMALLDGTIKPEDLDDEELARGYPRSRDGKFTGRVPTLIPKSLHDRMVRELFRRANEQLSGGLVDAANLMASVVRDTELPIKERMDAAKWLMERVMGKVPDIVVTGTEREWEKLFDSIHRGGPDIIDAEVVEDDGREP